MSNPFEQIWSFLQDAYQDLAGLVLISVLWSLLTILVVTAPPAAGALYYAAQELIEGRSVHAADFFAGFRQHFWMSWRWALAVLVVPGMSAFNYWFYGQVGGAWSKTVQGIFLGLIILWLLLNMYTFPLLLMQADRRLRIALRNSLVVYIRRPGFSLVLAGTILLLCIPSILLGLPLFILLPGVSVYLVIKSLRLLTPGLEEKRSETT